MRALQILLMICAVNIGLSFVNYVGLFTATSSTGQVVNMSDQTTSISTVDFSADGVSNLKNTSIMSDTDMQDLVSGSQSIWNVINFFKNLLGMSVVPYFYLKAWGAPDVVYNGWQAIITLLNGIAIAQYVRGISTKMLD